MTSAACIRKASRQDLPALLALYAQPGFNPDGVLDVAQAEPIFEGMLANPDHHLFLLCLDSGELVGSYSLLLMRHLAHRGQSVAIVEDVVVHADHRRQGRGRQMMEHALQTARGAGCYKLALSSSSRRDEAHAFYDALGFSRHGVSFVVTP